jgi:Sulfatase-modifying factor enzyme 1
MKALKIGGVIFAAVILTTLAIDASDSIRGEGGSLLAQLAGTVQAVCPVGMVHLPAALTFTCVDEFELSAGDDCIILNPENQIDTEINLTKKECLAINATKNPPWRFINREQAAVMCAKSGKRLPSASEWYQYVMGTNESKCNIRSSQVVAGDTYNECVSAAGVRNGVGNVWEWVADDVIDGVYLERKLPETGYVEQVDNGGMATLTALDKSNEVGNPTGYFWSNATGTYAIIRGGYYGSRSDAGVFTTHTYTAPNFSGAGIGFRCVQ